MAVMAAGMLLGLAACERDAALLPNHKSDGPTVAPSFAQFSDIPVPPGASMDMKGTLVLGSHDSWVGRLMLAARRPSSEMFDFYHSEMPRFGWEEVTSVRSAISVLTYRRAARVATIQLQATALGNTDVDFTVSPQGGGGCADPEGCGAPARSRPTGSLAPGRGR